MISPIEFMVKLVESIMSNSIINALVRGGLRWMS